MVSAGEIVIKDKEKAFVSRQVPAYLIRVVERP